MFEFKKSSSDFNSIHLKMANETEHDFDEDKEEQFFDGMAIILKQDNLERSLKGSGSIKNQRSNRK